MWSPDKKGSRQRDFTSPICSLLIRFTRFSLTILKLFSALRILTKRKLGFSSGKIALPARTPFA